MTDDATNEELDALVKFWDEKTEADQYTDDPDYCECKNSHEPASEDDVPFGGGPVTTYGRGTGLFPPKATLASVKDETNASHEVQVALMAHGLRTDTDSNDVVFELNGQRFRLELTSEGIAG